MPPVISQESKPHASKSASGSKRWASCVGSIGLIGKLPLAMKRKSSWYADQGTVAHAILEHCLEKDEHPSVFLDSSADHNDEDGTTIHRGDPEKGLFLIDEDMVDAIERGFDYVNDRLEEIRALNPDAEVQTEALVDLSWLRAEMFGTCDVSVDDFDLLEVMDYKHGAGVTVEADDNYQGRYYALGRAKEYDFRHKRVKITIIQPRAPHSEGRIRSEELSMEELRAWGEWLGERADLVDKATEELNDPCTDFDEWAAEYLVAGDHCTFCDAKTFDPSTGQLMCPAIQRKAYELAHIDFIEEDPEVADPMATIDTSPEALSRAAKWAPLFDKWAKAVQNLVEEEVMKGTNVEDFKIVAKKSNRKYKEDLTEAQIIAKAKKLGAKGVKKDFMKPPVAPAIKTPAQLEKMIPSKLRGEWSEFATYKPDTGNTVASIDDPRPAIELNPSNDFEDLENEFLEEEGEGGF